MSTKTKVRLFIYSHFQEALHIDQFAAEDWDDFLIIKVPVELFANGRITDEMETLSKEFTTANPHKQLVVVPDNILVEFYGVREATEDDPVE